MGELATLYSISKFIGFWIVCALLGHLCGLISNRRGSKTGAGN